MKRRRKKTRIGSSLLVLLLLLIPAVQAEKKRQPETFGRIGVTVFQDTGLALPGAEITLIPDPAAGSHFKMKKQQGVSDSRGEFVFRVPVTAMSYKVRAAARGYSTGEKAVAIEGETRMDVTFQLMPESKAQGR